MPRDGYITRSNQYVELRERAKKNGKKRERCREEKDILPIVDNHQFKYCDIAVKEVVEVVLVVISLVERSPLQHRIALVNLTCPDFHSDNHPNVESQLDHPQSVSTT